MPSEAMNENWAVVRDILDYRLLTSARDQHNEDASKMTPAQIEAWAEMVRAVEEDG